MGRLACVVLCAPGIIPTHVGWGSCVSVALAVTPNPGSKGVGGLTPPPRGFFNYFFSFLLVSI